MSSKIIYITKITYVKRPRPHDDNRVDILPSKHEVFGFSSYEHLSDFIVSEGDSNYETMKSLIDEVYNGECKEFSKSCNKEKVSHYKYKVKLKNEKD